MGVRTCVQVPKGNSDPPELQLQAVSSGNQTQIFCQSSLNSIPKAAAGSGFDYIFKDVCFILLHPFVYGTHAVRGQLRKSVLASAVLKLGLCFCYCTVYTRLLLYAPSSGQFTCLCLSPGGRILGIWMQPLHPLFSFFIYVCMCDECMLLHVDEYVVGLSMCVCSECTFLCMNTCVGVCMCVLRLTHWKSVSVAWCPPYSLWVGFSLEPRICSYT